MKNFKLLSGLKLCYPPGMVRRVCSRSRILITQSSCDISLDLDRGVLFDAREVSVLSLASFNSN